MCNCIKEVAQKFVDRQPLEGEIIEEARLASGWMAEDGNLVAVTRLAISLTLTGKKKPKLMEITHSYCPFCGEKRKKGGEYAEA